MPTYDYECSQCGAAREVFQKMSDPVLTDCPDCGGQGTLRRLIGSGAGLIFKGSGFYATDYKKNGCGTNGSAHGSEKKTDEPSKSCACAGSGECPLADKKS